MRHEDGREWFLPFHDEADRYTLKGALRDTDVELEDFLNEVK